MAAIAVGQWENAVGRVKLALGRLPAAAARVDLDTFRVPDSKFAREAEEACAELPPALEGHSYRTWLFGCALATVDGNTMDDELFYCGALLHDYGIVSPDGGPRLHARQRRSDAVLRAAPRTSTTERADLLADGICVHTTPGITVETDGRDRLLPAMGSDGRWRRTARVGRRSRQRAGGLTPLSARRFQTRTR